MRNLLWIVLAAVVLIGGYFLITGKSPQEVMEETGVAEESVETEMEEAADAVGEAAEDAAAATEEAAEDAKMQTRRFAKRQLTWFRNQFGDWDRTSAQ